MCGNICFLSHETTKMCFKTDTKKDGRTIVRLRVKTVVFGDEKAFTEGSRDNGFKSYQESHNNQNLLNDLFTLLGYIFSKKRLEENNFEEIKAEQGLQSPENLPRPRDIWVFQDEIWLK